jgi:hypothetical protein
MITLSMDGSWRLKDEENAVLLSPCHIQISPPIAAFYGSRAASRPVGGARFGCGAPNDVLDLF